MMIKGMVRVHYRFCPQTDVNTTKTIMVHEIASY